MWRKRSGIGRWIAGWWDSGARSIYLRGWEDEDEIAPSELACSQVIASEPQRLITNRFAAQAVAGYLNELFGERTLSTHVTFFHAKKMYMRGDRIQEGWGCPEMGTLFCFVKNFIGWEIVCLGHCVDDCGTDALHHVYRNSICSPESAKMEVGAKKEALKFNP
jgi:hypothetical protein